MPTLRRLRTVLLTVLLAAVLLPLSIASSQASSAGGGAHHPKPTIVLVHGAWADSSSWSDVTGRLQRDGYTVYAIPNPLRGIAIDAGYVRDFLGTIDGPVVLVGHSYGGAVITNAATGLPNVRALVYVNAFAPDEGETIQELVSAQPGSALAVADPTTVFKLVPYPGGPPGDADAYILQSVFPAVFANDLPARTAAVLGAVQRPAALSGFATPSGVPAWRTIPSWYVAGTADRVIPPAEQLSMAKRAHAHLTRVNAGHLSMISRPATVTDVIRDAARATSR